MTRKEILHEAEKCVCTDRENQYGPPEDSFKTIAQLWTSYFATRNKMITIYSQDVAIMMTLLKIGRIVSGQVKADNYVDACGYLACAGEIACKEETD